MIMRFLLYSIMLLIVTNLTTVHAQSTITVQQVHVGDTPIQLATSGDEAAPAVLFIHGSPGRWQAWDDYLADPILQDRMFMIAVDRPGYGGSDNGIAGTGLREQTRLIVTAIQQRFPAIKKLTVIGHSYGGPMALQMAVDYPDIVSQMILLAPAVSPELSKTRWYNRLAKMTLINPLLPRNLKRSNAEMLLLQQELKQLEPLLANIITPVSIIHGKKDWIVKPENADFIKEMLVNAAVDINLLADRGHFIPWQEYDLVRQTILQNVK